MPRQSPLITESIVAGQQYADLCDMLLILHNPRTPTTGLARIEASRKVEEKVKMLLRRICGVALSNRKHPAAMTTAGMAIVTCKFHMQQSHAFASIADDQKKAAIASLKCMNKGWHWTS